MFAKRAVQNKFRPSKAERALVERLVKQYVSNRHVVEVMLKQVSDAILGSKDLMANIHSTKARLKDPSHLRDKLFRKLEKQKAKGRTLGINETNLFRKVTDLAGIRLLHLHTDQFIAIDRALRAVFEEYRYPLVEKPSARTWDDEYRKFFAEAGVRTIKSPKMYTSVHYVIESNNVNKGTCEIQVRTLAEELWGEVDHSMNYPHESKIQACREQIKVLARLTSSCSRLVDSIFSSAKSSPLKRRTRKRRSKRSRKSKKHQ